MIHAQPSGTDRATRVAREPAPANADEVNAGQLLAFVERAERLREEKKGIEEDLKELFAEARGTGFDVPVLKDILKIRATDPDKRAEKEAIVEVYLAALGMV